MAVPGFRQVCQRLGLLRAEMGYDAVRRCFEEALGEDVAVYNEYHVLMIQLGKSVCRPRPLCRQCCLNGIYPNALTG